MDNDESTTSLPVPCSPVRVANPFRERFGVSMTIIAATSPEIKALNLPLTPTFPTEPEGNHNHCFSSLDLSPPSKTSNPIRPREKSTKERVSFFLDQTDDIKDLVSVTGPSPPSKASSTCYANDDEQDDLLRCLYSPRMFPHHSDENKENIHPNLVPQTPKKSTLNVGFHPDHPSSVKKSSRHTRRTSFHRRDSTTSLPSPAEIMLPPTTCDSETPLHRNVSLSPSAFTYDVHDSEYPMPTECRLNRQQKIKMAPKSLHLSTGFR